MAEKLKRRDFIMISGGTFVTTYLVSNPLFTSAKFVQNLINGGADLVTRVEKIHGVPTFTLNGKPYMVPVMETYDPNGTYFDDFAKAGTQIFSMNTNTGEDMYNRGVAIRPTKDIWDFSGLDHWVTAALKTRPDAMIMPRIYISTPQWWLEDNPSEVELWANGTPYKSGAKTKEAYENGPFPSLCSIKWREEMAFNLKKLLEHINNSEYGNRVFGYLIVGLNTEEWWHFGGLDYAYSKLYLQGFKDWLKRKYKSNETLRAAWHKKEINFEEVELPRESERTVVSTFRNLPEEMHVIDFWAYHNEIIPETIDFFAKVVKDTTKRTKVVGAFYPFTFWDRDPFIGHNAVHKYLASPNIDFSFVTSGFGDRLIGGCDYARAPVLSVQLHNQVFLFDGDYSSHIDTQRNRLRELSKPGLDEAAKIAIMDRPADDTGRGNTTEEDINILLRLAGFNLCSGTYQSIFDIYSGSFSSELHMKTIKSINELYARSGAYDRSSNAEVLFVSDEVSCSYVGASAHYEYEEGRRSILLERNLLLTQFTIPKIGAPVDQILLSDIERVDINRYKLIVFNNCYNITRAQRQFINDKVKGGDRVIMWAYAPGYFETNFSSDKLLSELAGMQLNVSNDESLVSEMIEIRKNEHPLSLQFDKAGLIALGDANQSYCKMISVSDKAAIPLGFHAGTNIIKLAVKDMKTWTSLYSFTANCQPGFYRELARYAGVHIYHEMDDTFHVNSSYMCIHANGRGRKVFLFPHDITVINAFDESILYKKTNCFFYDLKHGETKIFRIEKNVS